MSSPKTQNNGMVLDSAESSDDCLTPFTDAELAEMQAAEEAFEAEMWNQEQAQTLWAERGGYSAGLSRPGTIRYARPVPTTTASMMDDIVL